MGCPDVSGIISNILLAVQDESNAIYTSGTVNQMIFKDLPTLNGLMGTCFSGNVTDACISPCISGSAYQAILELLVAKDLTKRTLFGLGRTFQLTSFKEGDSTVTVADNYKNLADLYKFISAEFDRVVDQTKYTIVSQNPAAIHGADSGIQEVLPYQGYAVYRSYER